MARFLPDTDIDTIRPFSEQTVARALVSTLDNDWLVLHSYPWLRPERHGIMEGEADFVLLHPRHGFLVLEVKGGRIEFDPETLLWSQAPPPRRTQIKNPFEQARKNMHVIVDRLSALDSRWQHLPCAFGYAVVFPDCNYSGAMPPGADPQIMFGSSDLPLLGNRLTRCLQHWSGGHPRVPSADDFKKLRGGLLPIFRLVTPLGRLVEFDEASLLELTASQTLALSGMYACPRVLVKGVAGSGKTLLAVNRARTYAAEGKHTLFLCYNRNLADDLRLAVSAPNLTIRNFHGLCLDYARLARLAFTAPNGEDQEAGDEFWRTTAPNILIQALDEIDERFDAIVVDEAQDFWPDWWTAIEFLAAGDETAFYIFLDPAQNVYRTSLTSLPAMAQEYTLPTNCRNTKRIAQTCSRVIGTPIPTRDRAPEGVEPRIIRYNSESEMRQQCRQVLDELIGQDRLKPGQVALLAPVKRESLVTGLAPHRFTQDVTVWRQGNQILFSSMKAFKGLEAEAVILTDLDNERMIDPSDLYVACSRARHRLIVLTSSDSIERALALESAQQSV